MTKSKYFLLFCLSFISGISLGSYFSVQIYILFLLAGLSISFVFLSGHNKKIKIILLLFVFLIFGFVRIESARLDEKDVLEIEKLNNQEMLLAGEICEKPEIKNNKQKIILENIENLEGKEIINGKIIAYLNIYPEYNLGDRVSARGKIKTPEDFDGFEYKNYLFSKNIYYVLYYPEIKLTGENENNIYSQISGLRKYANNLVKKIFPQPQAGIVSAMTLAVKSDISDEIITAFNKTGTRHIIAISGLHMTIVAVTLMYVLLAIGLNRNHAFYFSILGIIFFVALVGFPPSAVRAAVMGGLVLLAVKVGRLTNAGNAIIFAGVLMLLYNPNLLRYDVGFQLSFSAALGIIYIFPKLDDFFKKYSNFLNIKTIFLITVSAQAAVLPIIINNFGSFSLLSVFTNILILPFVPVVMLGGFLIIIIGSANLFVAQILSWPIWLILFYQIKMIELFSGFNAGYFNFENLNIWLVAVYYGVLILGLLIYNKKKSQRNLSLT